MQVLKKSITYLEYTIDSTGLHPITEKLTTLTNNPAPKYVAGVQKFLRLTNYYQKYLPNLASKLYQVSKLLRKEERFRWTAECQAAFQQIKEEITSKKVLVHYNPNLTLTLATDTSHYGRWYRQTVKLRIQITY